MASITDRSTATKSTTSTQATTYTVVSVTATRTTPSGERNTIEIEHTVSLIDPFVKVSDAMPKYVS